MSKSEINNCSIQLLDPDPRVQKKQCGKKKDMCWGGTNRVFVSVSAI